VTYLATLPAPEDTDVVAALRLGLDDVEREPG
jgi:hypothetical protein